MGLHAGVFTPPSGELDHSKTAQILTYEHILADGRSVFICVLMYAVYRSFCKSSSLKNPFAAAVGEGNLPCHIRQTLQLQSSLLAPENPSTAGLISVPPTSIPLRPFTA